MPKAEKEKAPLNEEQIIEETIAEAAEQAAENAEFSSTEEVEKSMEKDLEETKNHLLRTMAEFDNYRKRTQKEKEVMFDFASAQTLAAILPVLDSLKLSLKHSDENAAFRTGVELVIKQFDEVLTKLGLSPIETEGKQFDPVLHEAVMHIEDGNLGENTVVEEFQKGYMFKDKVIRPSMVKVAN